MKAIVKKQNGLEAETSSFFNWFEGIKIPPDYREYTNKKTGLSDPIIDWGHGRILHKSTLEKSGYIVEIKKD